VTIADVAAAAGVSRSTASRAISGHPSTSAAARQAVLAAATALGYRVNPAARALRGGSSRLIGLAVTNLVNASIQTAVARLHDRAHEAGYQVLVAVTGGNADREAEVIEALADHRIAGLVVMPGGSPDRINRLPDQGIPVVALIRDLRGLEVPVVLDNDRAGAASATTHLIELGHEAIGFVGGPPSVHSGRERYLGYREAMRKAKLPLDPALIFRGPFDPSWGAEVAETLSRTKSCSAVLVANHEALFGVVQALAQAKVAIPDELSLVGFEDAPLFRFWHPSVSVVDTHPAELAETAFSLLMERIAGSHDGGRVRVIVGSTLVARESTAQGPARRSMM
jgi:LacI family transcriptional regulator